MNDHPTVLVDYYYPDPVDQEAVAYDRLWLEGFNRDAMVIAIDVPGLEAIYWCQVGVRPDSPLRNVEQEVRRQTTTYVVKRVGERVAAAAEDDGCES